MPRLLVPLNRAPTAGPVAPSSHLPPVHSGLSRPMLATSVTRSYRSSADARMVTDAVGGLAGLSGMAGTLPAMPAAMPWISRAPGPALRADPAPGVAFHPGDSAESCWPRTVGIHMPGTT